MAVTDLTPHALADSADGLDTLIAAAERLGPEDVTGPSALEGWTRGHVLAHVTNLGEALAGQARAAARGEVVPVYASRAARDAGIEANAGRTLAEHLAALRVLRDELTDAWPAPGSPLWDAPSGYRDGPLSGCLLAWWREVRIHTVDALTGTGQAVGYATWDETLCAHLRDFLAVRLPDGVAVADVAGDPRDVTVWLAGRVPDGPLPDDLPELGPWPSSTPAPS